MDRPTRRAVACRFHFDRWRRLRRRARPDARLSAHGASQRAQPRSVLVADRIPSASRGHPRARHWSAARLRDPDLHWNGGDIVGAITTCVRRYRRNDDGAELIEMALITPVLLLIR